MLLRILFWLSIVVLFIALFSITAAQWMPVEFADWKLRNSYYSSLVFVAPAALLLTMSRTMNRKRSRGAKIWIVSGTVLGSVLVFMIIGYMRFVMSFNGWQRESVLYQNIHDPSATIEIQYNDCAMVAGELRTVEVRPCCGAWNFIREADTLAIDSAEWR